MLVQLGWTRAVLSKAGFRLVKVLPTCRQRSGTRTGLTRTRQPPSRSRSVLTSRLTSLMSGPEAGSAEGFHTWTVEEVHQYEAAHPIGTKARLALALTFCWGFAKLSVALSSTP
jgi:hypothetical protein